MLQRHYKLQRLEFVRSPRLGTLLITNPLNHGAFASVMLAHSAASPATKFAIKRTLLAPSNTQLHSQATQLTQSTLPQVVAAEIKALSDLADVPSVIHIHDIVTTPTHIDMVFEYCHSDLFQLLGDHNSPFAGGIRSFPLARRLMLDIMDAVLVCHSRGVFHRDLKAENILISAPLATLIQFASSTDSTIAHSAPSSTSTSTIKLCDFGLSTFKRFTNDVGCGSGRYMAPECFPESAINNQQVQKPKTDSAFASSFIAAITQPFKPILKSQSRYRIDSALADTWSIGILIINILAGQDPWQCATSSNQDFSWFLAERQILRESFDLSPEMERVLLGMLEPDASKRWTLSKARAEVAAIKTSFRG
eukprot:jgi/Hompol1/4770/HPOL_003870-RA